MTDWTGWESTGRSRRRNRPTRGQANLIALIGALFALTTAMVIGVAVADSALAGEVRDTDERHAASAVAGGLVAADSPLTNRTNVLDGSAVDSLTTAQVRALYPVLDDRSVRITLDDTVLVSDGTPEGGTAMRRIVLVERTQERTVQPRFSGGNRATLPRRTDQVDVVVNPPENVSVSTVRADERTVLHDPDDGLSGRYSLSVSPRETVELTFVANGSLSRGDVSVTVYPRVTSKAQLEVTVDG